MELIPNYKETVLLLGHFFFVEIKPKCAIKNQYTKELLEHVKASEAKIREIERGVYKL